MLVPLIAVFNAASTSWECLNMRQQTTASEFVQENASKEHHFLRNLSAFADTIPATELRSLAVYQSFSGFEMINGWARVVLFLLFGFALLQVPSLLTFELVQARFSWAHYWRPWLAYLATVAGTGLLVFWGIFVFSNLTYPILQPQRPAREIRCRLDLETAARIVQSCLRQRGYDSDNQQFFVFDTVPKGDTVAELRLPLYRRSHANWRLGWSGARRTAPLLDFQLLSSVRPPETVITLNSDAGALLSREGAQEWIEAADAVAAAVKEKQRAP
jgi:hypothetical protein